MTIYYVATNGSDNKDGKSTANAWGTLNYAFGQLGPGDTLKIRGGEYYGGGTTAKPKEVEATIKGTASAPIVIEAYQSEEVTITGKAGQLGGINTGLPQARTNKHNQNTKSIMYGATGCDRALVNLNYCRYLTIRNITVRDSLGRSINVVGTRPDYKGREMDDVPAGEWNSRFIAFENVHVYKSRTHHVLILAIHEFRWSGGSVQKGVSFYPHNRWGRQYVDENGKSIKIREHNPSASVTCGGANFALFENIYFDDCYGEALIFSSNSSSSNRVTVQDCVIGDHMAAGLYLHACTNSIAQRNLLFGSIENDARNSRDKLSGNCIRVQGSEGDKDWDLIGKNNSVLNNIILNKDNGIILAGSGNVSELSGTVIAGNTILNSWTYGLSCIVTYHSDTTIVNNLIHQKSGNGFVDYPKPGQWDNRDDVLFDYNGYSSVPEAHHDGSGQSNDQHKIVGNLDIVNPNTKLHKGDSAIENFRLLMGSDAINAGISGYVDHDHEENTRSDPPDMGALEYGSEGAPETPYVQAVLDQDIREGDVPLTVIFDGSASIATNDTIVSYEWAYGDGTTGTGATPTKVYDTVGIYDVSLKVTGASGATHTKLKERHITVTTGSDPGAPASGTEIEVVETVVPATEGAVVIPHSLGLSPALVLLFASPVTGLNQSVNDSFVSAGMSDGISQVAIAGSGRNNVAKSDSGSQIRDDYAVIFTNYNGVIQASATLSIGSTDITLDWDLVDGNQYKVTAVLFAGTATKASVIVANQGDSIPLSFTPDILLPLLSANASINANQSTVRQSYGVVDASQQMSINVFERDNQDTTQIFQQASTQFGATYRGDMADLPIAINGAGVDIGTNPDWPGPVIFAAIKFAGNVFDVAMVDTPSDLTPVDYSLGVVPAFALAITSNLDTVDASIVSGNLGHFGMFVFDGVDARHHSTEMKDATSPTKNQNQLADAFHIREITGANSSDVVVATPSFTGTGLRLSASGSPKSSRKMLLLQIGEATPSTELPIPTIDVNPVSVKINEDVTVESLNSGAYTFSVDFGDGSAEYTGATLYTHQYTVPGNYDIVATLHDNGNSESTTYVITVSPADLVASFTVVPTSGASPLEATLDGSGSEAGTTIVIHTWKIVESHHLDEYDVEIPNYAPVIELEGVTVTNVFLTGTYSIELTITDANDSTRFSKLLKHLVLTASSIPPVAGFEVFPNTGASPLTVVVTPDDTLHDELLASEYWIVDGESYPGVAREFSFTGVGNHTIERIITTVDGRSSLEKTVVTTSQTSFPIGYSMPDSVGKGTTNTYKEEVGEGYHKHTHKVIGTETGQDSSIISTNAVGATRLSGIGLGTTPPIPGDGNESVLNAEGFLRTSLGLKSLKDEQDLIIQASKDIVTFPESGRIVPVEAHTQSIGSRELPYSEIHIDQVIATSLVAREVIATIGGGLVVAPTTKLGKSIWETDGGGDGGDPERIVMNMVLAPPMFVEIGDYLYIQGTDDTGITQSETFEVASASSQAADGSWASINVYRNVSGDGRMNWSSGEAVINTGRTVGGLIDLYAELDLYGGAIGPAIAILARDPGATPTQKPWADIWAMAALGNLNGRYGIDDNIYGVALGRDSNDSSYMLAVDDVIAFYGAGRQKVLEIAPDRGVDIEVGQAADANHERSYTISAKNTTHDREIMALLSAWGGSYYIGDVWGGDGANAQLKVAGSKFNGDTSFDILTEGTEVGRVSAEFTVSKTDGVQAGLGEVGLRLVIENTAGGESRAIFIGLPDSDPGYEGQIYHVAGDLKISI